MVIIQLLAAIACGGLGGAVFTWLVNRRLRLPPVLQLRLLREEGEKEKNQQAENNFEDVRYYHVRISNAPRFSPATDVQVFLTRIERGATAPTD